MNGPDDLDLHRMDDDGAALPFNPEAPTIRIGIAPEPAPARAESTLKLVGTADATVERAPEQKVVDNGGIILKDVRKPKERLRTRVPADENGPSRTVRLGGGDGPVHGPSMLVGANGLPISATPEPVELVSVTGETLNSLTWPDYMAWRKTKCRPYDYESGPKSAVAVPAQIPVALRVDNETIEFRYRALEEIDQATLEFIGEVAELGELFHENGASTFFGEKRDKLIDECGDILFCGCWVLDAWGLNPLSDEADDLEILRVTEEDDLAVFAGIMASNEMGMVLGNSRFISVLGGQVLNFMLNAQTSAGLLANSFKKLRYQRREQDVKKQVERVFKVFFIVNQILILANSSVEEALKANMNKLNARYPNGYVAGQGGGIRTGEGA